MPPYDPSYDQKLIDFVETLKESITRSQRNLLLGRVFFGFMLGQAAGYAYALYIGRDFPIWLDLLLIADCILAVVVAVLSRSLTKRVWLMREMLRCAIGFQRHPYGSMTHDHYMNQFEAAYIQFARTTRWPRLFRSKSREDKVDQKLASGSNPPV